MYRIRFNNYEKKVKLIIGNLTILLLTLLLCLLFGELVIRFLIGTKNIAILATPPIVKDNELIYKNAPSWKGKIGSSSESSYKVEINSLGLNERELNFKKGKNTIRILFLGDSITFGLGVDVDKTFVRKVENLSNSQLPCNPILSETKRVETLNGGVSGYFTWQEIAFLRKVGLKYQPDIVVLDFYLNDLEPCKSEQEIKEFRKAQFAYLQSKYEIPVPFKGFLREKSRLYWAARRAAYNLMITKLSYTSPARYKEAQDKPQLSSDNWKTKRNEFLNLTSQADWGIPWNKDACYDNFRKYIRELKDLTQKENFKLVVVFFPVEYQLETKFLEDEPQKRLTKITAEENTLSLDLLPLMRGNIKPDSIYYDWCHLTIKGHQFVAEKITQFLKDKGVI